MKKYFYNNYRISCKVNFISIENKTGMVIKNIVLKRDDSLLGNINIPLSNICTIQLKFRPV